MAKIYAPYAQPWAPAWGARDALQAEMNYAPYGYGWASPSNVWFSPPVERRLPGLSEVVDYIRDDGQLGAFFIPAILLTGTFAILAEKARQLVLAWRKPETTTAEVRLQATTLKTECLQLLQAGQITAEQCQALIGAIEQESDGVGSWLQKTFAKHGTVIIVGVATTVLGAVLLRAILR